MRYNDLDRIWRTGEIVEGRAKIANVPGDQSVKIPMERCEAGLGDFIKAYFDHLKLPWYKRDPDWRLVEERMRELLNGGKVSWFV